MATIFFTGFPGFLGSELLPRVMARQDPGVTATCLVQPKFAPLAHRRAAELKREHPTLAGRIRLIEGDITAPDLGLGSARELKDQATEVFHLAAVYDLAVKRDLAMRVNVDGTHHVLQFTEGCPSLKRLHHVSTCFVSGRHDGLFRESDLQLGQRFNNFYEETKYLSEVEVQRKARDGMPVTVYRPSIVVGDSVSGATQKYDGPYFVMQFLLRQPKLAVLPVVPSWIDRTRVNVAPRDFVIRAMAHLSGLEASRGKVYALCDPDPLTAGQMIEAIGRATERNVIKLPLPFWVARNALAHGPGVYRLMQIPPEAIDYFVLPTRFSCDNTLADLEGSGIRCPSFRDYVPRLVSYMRAHPEIGHEAMV